MKTTLRAICVVLLAVWSVAVFGQAQVNGVRMWPAPESLRLVFDVSGPVEHGVFTLHDPERLVIDLKNARLVSAIPAFNYQDTMLRGIRSAARGQRDLRVVLDLRRPVRPKTFLLKPNQEYGHRLVIDLHDTVARPATRAPAVRELEVGGKRDIVVAIDAGHGGEDPGAIGPSKTLEKDVTLAVARRLAALLEKEPGMRPVLIRDGDYYISLRGRMEKARQQRADLFISLHADAFHNNRARGSSVYTLSPSGASSEAARWLAQRENASDLIGGVSLDDKDDLLASVLLDLSQTAAIEASVNVATRVLQGLKRVGDVHKREVEQAGFAVLKSPDIPSVLVEMAFISNPMEERKLREARHQQQLAQAIMDGVRNYFTEHPPPGTLLASAGRRHVIARGETLSTIARRYQVGLDALRDYNGISGDMLRVGDVLRIPLASDG